MQEQGKSIPSCAAQDGDALDRVNTCCQLREEGKRNYYNPERDPQKRRLGAEQLDRASWLGDAEASYILGCLILDRNPPQGSLKEAAAMEKLHAAGTAGYPDARRKLRQICSDRYHELIRTDSRKQSAPLPLSDFEGKPIFIHRAGWSYPVEAQLSFDGWTNNLALCAKVDFSDIDLEDNALQACTQAIEAGFQDWAGNYTVFGGQPLTVSVRIKPSIPFQNRITVFELSEDFADRVKDLAGKLTTGAKKEKLQSFYGDRRPFASMGIRRWSLRSFKNIFFHSEDIHAEDRDDLRCYARHEFGHVLGLGDLYAGKEDSLVGVDSGTFPVLECYRLFDKTYHRVMCDNWAPVTDNDIEMLLLAFSRNRYQSFQNDGLGEISDALIRRC